MARDDVRARRAERVRSQKFKDFLPKHGKTILIGVVIVAALLAAATFYKPPPVSKFAHEHPAFAIWADNQQYDFNDPAYDISQVSDKVHIHYDGSAQRAATWHVEANFPNGIPDLSLQQIFAQYGVQVRKGFLRLDTRDGHTGEQWTDAGNATWRVFVSPRRDAAQERGPFEELVPGSALLPEGAARTSGDYSQFIARGPTTGDPGDMILLTYNATEAQIAQQQAQMPEPRA